MNLKEIWNIELQAFIDQLDVGGMKEDSKW